MKFPLNNYPGNLPHITLYVGLWGWQILAILFLCSSVLMVASLRTPLTIVFSLAFIFIFAFCEYKSLRRKQEFYNEIQPEDST